MEYAFHEYIKFACHLTDMIKCTSNCMIVSIFATCSSDFVQQSNAHSSKKKSLPAVEAERESKEGRERERESVISIF